MKKHILIWVATAALLVCAWGVSKATLPDDAPNAPFPTVAQIGEPASTRNLVVTVTDVHLADRVADAEGWSADGTWLVVDLEAATGVTQDQSSSRLAELTIGDRTFSATDRGTTFVDQRLVTGVPRSGSLAFELPDDVTGDRATLRLGMPGSGLGDVQRDTVIDLPIDLATLPDEAEVLLDENGWAR
ncbi:MULTISPECIES: DUF4352 domain-containing protein [unclassified Microbacterium]|uniref:DUF4352 domain-containing protein n=1 Tax=unclassified Microbacterium TaxID=2609290 RepID=UPI001604FC4D|nr:MULTISPECIES: DUF4352 domain-containing protein [unclassified Microbacterium]QNA93651.1 DUF4352 domain-containing protein [Microbacterium sp. Se63.02b]QYM63917.1 DUF4352 domain-containing protein [Microbacterium sp. Se5.02b]